MPQGRTEPGLAWARAVELGGQGRYAAAETLLRRLRTGPAVPQAIRAHAAVSRASHLRQVGSHGRATGLDAAAARLARPLAGERAPEPGSDVHGTGPAAALGDALAGLAADAIGRCDAATAGRMLRRAAPWCGVPGDDPPACRTAVRWLWVRAETSLLTGDADGAVRASATARALATAYGSPRHVLKSRLELDAIADEAGATGLLPLRWAALLASADTAGDAGSGDGATAPNGRHADGPQSDTLGRQTVAQSRRHAAMLTVNVLYLRSDPVARAGLRESAWLSAAGAVP